MALIESSTLKQNELLWMPNNPLAYAARKTNAGFDFLDLLFGGKTPIEKMQLGFRIVGFCSLGVTSVLLLSVLFYWLEGSYGLAVASAVYLCSGILLTIALAPMARSVVDPR
jgi:hypothetical protein